MEKLWDVLRDEDCHRCVLCETAQTVCLIGQGPYPCEYMLIGEGPGFREDDIQKPFAGKAGHLLDRILTSININRKDLYITNIVHCRPPENRKPKKKEMDACRIWLMKEIEYVKPKKIILLGRAAVYGLFEYDELSIEDMRDKTYSYKPTGAKVYVTYHPAAALRKPFLIRVIKKDLNRAFHGSNSTKKEAIYGDLSNETLASWKTNPPKAIAVDIETPGGVVFYKNFIECLSITDKAFRAGFVQHPEKIKNKLKNLFESPVITKIGHNLKFDLKGLIYEGYMSEKSLIANSFFCTMIAFNVLDENYLEKGLEHLAVMFTSMLRWKNDDEDFSSPQRLRLRNLKDTDATKRLYNVLSKRLEKENLLIPFKIDMNMMKVLVSAELNGVKVDVSQLNDLSYHVEEELQKLKKFIPFNPRSNPQMTQAMRELGVRSPKKTEAGGYSWDKKVLERLSRELDGSKKQTLERILQYNKLFGIQTKFLNNLPAFLDPENKVHPVFNQTKSQDDTGDETGTVTGRLSCKNPNLQQIPRDRETLEREINPRRLFIPSHEKGFILTADYNQIEVRIAAHDANDDLLIALLLQGEDIHRLIASEVLQKPKDKITKDERKDIKQVVFGIMYMISAWGLSEKLGCPKEKAQRYINFFFRAFPKQEERIINTENYIVEHQEVSNLFGRKRRLPGANRDTGEGRALIRQGVNFPIQGGSVDIVKIAMFNIFSDFIEAGLKTRTFANVHDAIDVDGYPGEEKEVIEIVRRNMENPRLEEYGVELKVPLTATLQIGKNWLEVKEV